MKIQYKSTTDLKNIFKILDFNTHLILNTIAVEGKLVNLKQSFKEQGDLIKCVRNLNLLKEDIELLSAYVNETHDLIMAYQSTANVNKIDTKEEKNEVSPLTNDDAMHKINSIAESLQRIRGNNTED